VAATRPTFIPALRFHALTRVYDRLIRVALREEAFKDKLVRQARVEPRHRILDLGCRSTALCRHELSQRKTDVRAEPGAGLQCPVDGAPAAPASDCISTTSDRSVFLAGVGAASSRPIAG